jgi:hypothetical protein
MADPLETACSLVGRFQYHFGRVEQKIDQAVIKLLDLDEKAGPIVTGSVDFAKKANFVRTSAYEQAQNDNDKQFAEKTCDEVFKINNLRQIAIHSSFELPTMVAYNSEEPWLRMGEFALMIRPGMIKNSPSTTRQ